MCTTLYDKVCQWLATGQWFSPGPPVSSTNKTDCHEITEILLKVPLNTIKQTIKEKPQGYVYTDDLFFTSLQYDITINSSRVIDFQQ